MGAGVPWDASTILAPHRGLQKVREKIQSPQDLRRLFKASERPLNPFPVFVQKFKVGFLSLRRPHESPTPDLPLKFAPAQLA